ncbi:MAG: type II secretion system F family protein [Candidatus Nomurabacteria bacterium]|nr:MAG: type II secretion system F family protein [Candidatus Nomurabacteria bacterium]
MPNFEYTARDSQGNTSTGIVEAPTESIAQDVLRERGLIVTGISERQRKALFQTSLNIFNRVPRRDVTIFSRQLAVMISATVPIVQALRILVKQTENVAFKIIISEVADEVDGGSKLSATLGKYPHVFNDFFVHMIRSGETTGKLDETLNYLADQQEKDYDLISKIKGSMTYPVFILGALVAVGILMMIFVIPQLTDILTAGGQELPIMTRALIATSAFLQTKWWVLLIVIALLYAAYRFVERSEQGQDVIDRLKLHFPIFGQIFQRIYLVRFARSLSTLISSGVPITRSLEIVADVIDNRLYRKLTKETIEAIEGGKSISYVFAQNKDIPPMLTQMMSIGESTGKLDFILEKLANFYSRELENNVANLVSLIEPLILVVMGVAVAFLVIAILLPMYNLSSAI